MVLKICSPGCDGFVDCIVHVDSTLCYVSVTWVCTVSLWMLKMFWGCFCEEDAECKMTCINIHLYVCLRTLNATTGNYWACVWHFVCGIYTNIYYVCDGFCQGWMSRIWFLPCNWTKCRPVSWFYGSLWTPWTLKVAMQYQHPRIQCVIIIL